MAGNVLGASSVQMNTRSWSTHKEDLVNAEGDKFGKVVDTSH